MATDPSLEELDTLVEDLADTRAAIRAIMKNGGVSEFARDDRSAKYMELKALREHETHLVQQINAHPDNTTHRHTSLTTVIPIG